MPAKRKCLVAVLAAALLGMVAAQSGTSSTPRQVPRALSSIHAGTWCAKLPTSRPKNMVPVWVHLEIKTAGGDVVPGIGVTVLPFKGFNVRLQQFGVWSGCWAVPLFDPNHVPNRMCAALHLGITAPGGNCQPVRVEPSGQRVIYYSLVAS